MKRQILLIHGGSTFDSYESYITDLSRMNFDIERIDASKNRWNRNLDKFLGERFEVIMPQMPCKQNAKYLEWKIYFEKIIPFLREEVVLIGHSLGGIFLVKYLSENDFPVKIGAVFLVAPPFDNKDSEYSLGDFILPESLKRFEDQCEKIVIYFSKDDPVVPFVDLEKYKKAIPSAEKIIFKDKGHFNVNEFPEIIEKIKGL